jgi:DNA-binding NarL/FixJ family response regulator
VTVLNRRSDKVSVAAAQQILQRERLDDATVGPKVAALVALMYAGRTDEADACCVNLLEQAELRVASLAADGHPNREIARQLSIIASTVEQHLTRIYRNSRSAVAGTYRTSWLPAEEACRRVPSSRHVRKGPFSTCVPG